MLSGKKKRSIIEKERRHGSDTGSAKVQAALLGEQIDALAKHLKKNPADEHSRRGLLKMVARRRSHLKYLGRSKNLINAGN